MRSAALFLVAFVGCGGAVEPTDPPASQQSQQSPSAPVTNTEPRPNPTIRPPPVTHEVDGYQENADACTGCSFYEQLAEPECDPGQTEGWACLASGDLVQMPRMGQAGNCVLVGGGFNYDQDAGSNCRRYLFCCEKGP